MASRGTHKIKLKYVDQVGIIIKDLNKVMEIWSKQFGIRPWITHERDILDDNIYPRKLKLAFVNIGQLQFELLEPIQDKLKQGWLDTHGEGGMHHLGFRVDDLAGTVSNLEAQMVKPYMYYPDRFVLLESWPGGVIFEFMQRRDRKEVVTSIDFRERSKFHIKTIDQIGIMVKDINKVMETWSRIFGIEPWETRELDILDDKIYPRKLKLAFANVGQMQFELLQPIQDKLKQDWLDTYGEGIHHLGFRVDNLAVEVSKLEAQDNKPYMYYPDRFALLESWPNGIIFELMQRRDI